MKIIFIFLQYCLPQHGVSRLAGKLAASKNKTIKNSLIKLFIKKFDISLSEAVIQDHEEFASFNDFFTRALKKEARPISENAVLTSPADGAFSQLGSIKDGRIFQAKNRDFSAEELLVDEALANKFEGGEFATIYLSPKDYHRVHMPISGRLKSMSYVPGDLFSVNETTTEVVPRLFARNERAICIFDTEIGPVALIMVGAMIVASIETTWAGQIAPALTRHIEHWQYDEDDHVFNQGDELGRFKLGSTVVLLLPKNTIKWQADLQAGSIIKMGQKIAGEDSLSN